MKIPLFVGTYIVHKNKLKYIKTSFSSDFSLKF